MTRRPCIIHLVAGTRPNIIKIAPLHKVLSQQDWCTVRLIFIQQHNPPSMTTEIFEDLGVLDIVPLDLDASGYGPRIGEIMARYEGLCTQEHPDMVVVSGDVDASMATTLAAKRLGIPVVHLEAGLRSGDMLMPEEINRVVIDSISDLMLSPSEEAMNNLIFGEGKPPEKVEFVGNIMIDSLSSTVKPDLQATLLSQYKLTARSFAVATFHRPSNVDSKKSMEAICELLLWLAQRTAVLFPAHPRTLKQLERWKFDAVLRENKNICLVPALRYAEFVNLVAASALVLTDSGGIQEETTWLGIPCFTFRDTTERPVTIRDGTNCLVNLYDVRSRLDVCLNHLASNAEPRRTRIPLWDGQTAFRCAAALNRWWTADLARSRRRLDQA
jgi:UDP-N-acetylglucosamine 2-epimerase (non-hydrolysing)